MQLDNRLGNVLAGSSTFGYGNDGLVSIMAVEARLRREGATVKCLGVGVVALGTRSLNRIEFISGIGDRFQFQ